MDYWFLRITCLCFICYITTISANVKTSKKIKSSNVTKFKESIEDYGWDVWCKTQANGYNCLSGGLMSKFYYDVQLRDCTEAEVGNNCPHNLNHFSYLDDCHETCRNINAWHQLEEEMELPATVYCRLQPDYGACSDYYPMFYYDLTSRECKGFSYSGCGGNYNRFSTTQECSATCIPVVKYEK